jgi:molybdate transport system regulatory protein
MPLDISSVLGQDTIDKRIDILQRIEQFGSISQAARSAGLSYKAAWQAIDTLSNLAGVPLVEKVVGGASGGGAKLTADGYKVLEAASALQKIRSQVLTNISRGDPPMLAALAASSLRMSARNIIPCKVTNLHGGLSKVKVELEVCFGNSLKASVTTESAQLLGLKPGMTILAIFKATAARVTDSYDKLEGGRLFLGGTVLRLPQKDHGGEVTLRMPNGINVVGYVKSPHSLEIGQKGYLTIEEESIILSLLG